MNKFEIVVESINAKNCPKPVTALIIQPDEIGENTGIMLFNHGWYGNRYQYRDIMEWTADNYDVVCIGVEYRQSGFDFNPITGSGAYRPYDMSFYQVFDVLNVLRYTADLLHVNRDRMFIFGGSLGGHISLIASVFAPNTFAFVYATSLVCRVTPYMSELSGRSFSEHECLIRDTLFLCDRINTPIYLEHGTSDELVPHTEHTAMLYEKLKSQGKNVRVEFHENGDHYLMPTSTRAEQFKKVAPDYLRNCKRSEPDDFLSGNLVEIPCGNKKLAIDWSKSATDELLFQWQECDS